MVKSPLLCVGTLLANLKASPSDDEPDHDAEHIAMLDQEIQSELAAAAPNLFPEDDDLDDEFWDIATSPVWEDAQVHVLMTTMDLFRDKGWKMAAFSESDKQQQPLAKLISPFRKASETINAEDVLDQTLKQFQTLPTVMELGDVSFQ